MMDNVNDFMANARKAFEPVGKLGDMGSSLFEKTVDLNVQIATDMLNYTTNQLEAIAAFESPTQYIETQQKLASEYSERAQSRAKAYYVTLHPSGACDYATVTVQVGEGDTVSIATKGRLGRFEVTRK